MGILPFAISFHNLLTNTPSNILSLYGKISDAILVILLSKKTQSRSMLSFVTANLPFASVGW